MTRHLHVLLTLIITLTWTASARGAPLISEVFYDAVGSDQAQVFVELYGVAGSVLDDYVLQGINGSNGAAGPILTLSGVIPGDGFFVIADADLGVSMVANADLLLDFDFQNGPDSVQLLDPFGVLLDAIGYGDFSGGEIFAGEGTPVPDPAAGESLARLFANVDTDDNLADFVTLATPTPGSGPIALPEPHGLVLLGACLAGLAAVRRPRT